MGSHTEPYPGNGIFKSFTETWHSKPYPQISPKRPELTATGKIVFITVGGSGIGKATAIAFAQAGAKSVAIFGRRVSRLKLAAEEIRKVNTEGTTRVIFEAVDLSQRAAVDEAFSRALQETGGARVDVFLSGAGVIPAPSPVSGYSERNLHDGLEVNLVGTFNAVQAVLPLLHPKAKIFDITSGIAHINPVPDVWLYAAIKGANTKMFNYLQAENPDLHVVSIQPGVLSTEFNGLRPDQAQDDVELPAHFHVWLASPEAEFLKGKLVWVNWDVDELKARAEQIKRSLLLKVLLNGVPM